MKNRKAGIWLYFESFLPWEKGNACCQFFNKQNYRINMPIVILKIFRNNFYLV